MKPAERDELLTEVYELLLAQDEKIDALGQMLAREREVTRQTLAHCERLVKKDEDMQRAMGIYGLVRRANESADVPRVPPACEAGGMPHLLDDTGHCLSCGKDFGLSEPGVKAQGKLRELGDRIKNL